MMDTDWVAKAFKELGHPFRLTIFRYLVKSRHQGLPVGGLQQVLDIPNSTLSHHISALVAAGLIQQQREGRTLYCIPQYQTLNNLITFLLEECCVWRNTVDS